MNNNQTPIYIYCTIRECDVLVSQNYVDFVLLQNPHVELMYDTSDVVKPCYRLGDEYCPYCDDDESDD